MGREADWEVPSLQAKLLLPKEQHTLPTDRPHFPQAAPNT